MYVFTLYCIILESTDKYIAVTIPMTWLSAQSYCREKCTDLASMRNQQEKEAIMRATVQSHWWIGLSRVAWTWSDQSNSSFRAWGKEEPNNAGWEHCARTAVTLWADVSCDRKIPFICSGRHLIIQHWSKLKMFSLMFLTKFIFFSFCRY